LTTIESNGILFVALKAFKNNIYTFLAFFFLLFLGEMSLYTKGCKNISLNISLHKICHAIMTDTTFTKPGTLTGLNEHVMELDYRNTHTHTHTHTHILWHLYFIFWSYLQKPPKKYIIIKLQPEIRGGGVRVI